ncbi:hypothetical protein LTR10_023850 [Elasticomyces elasticus]|uniref:Heterokaryon incompatibility domain-containing protein n=1 Tax=Exophiala sideris TaxID=1016849 RepID=A0ABR0IYU2_9EURO|nr:hypothetical protein LTR10_023850 [Elasticomyces elasticus]KAK5022126.1 hypothetical protein LTS07_010376 [Exophiala sideris]KAK5025069.1 hypothetical protein LTR13_010629 [Exophiala sideris]KAK5051163.1 hypothetical protein LTR69_010375 [Exophiala sideris]KAK5176828.1 hypothetical protein LTR44_010649 [Eurotiomycetes sp. CCFEE 6388]
MTSITSPGADCLDTSITHEHVHVPLPTGQWFRLLRLLPGNYDDKIRCELVPCEIRRALPYEAISYCWGDPHDLVAIQCNGSSLNITNSLAMALKRFRLEREPRLLWADGICINQLSIDEQGHQVGMMDLVYGESQGTLIWLGEPDGSDISAVFELLRKFNSYMVAEVVRLLPSSDHVLQAIYSIRPLPHNHPLLAMSDDWTAIGKLFERPWFRRVWVLQEIGVAKKATASCGGLTIDFTEIALFAQLHHCVKEFLPQYANIATEHTELALADIWARFGTAQSWTNGNPTLKGIKEFWMAPQRSANGIIEVLHTSRSFKATRDVDHVYGFLGHAEAKSQDGHSNLIEVDYKRPTEETYLLLATQLLLSTRSLRLLCVVQHWHEDLVDAERKGLPSWVPTFHSEPTYEFLVPHSTYDAAKAQDFADNVVISVNGRALTVAALITDSVGQISALFSTDKHTLPQIVYECWNYYKQTPVKDPDMYYTRLCWLLVQVYDLPSSLQADFMAYCQQHCSIPFYQHFASIPQFAKALLSTTNISAHRFESRASEYCARRRVFLTQGGLCGMALRPARKGDKVAFIFGCPMPVLLRPSSDPLVFRFVGQVLIPGLMRGQILEMWKKGSLQKHPQNIVLV